MVQLVKRLEPPAWRLLFYTFQKILAVGIGKHFSQLPQINAPRHSVDARLQELLMALRANDADRLTAGCEPLVLLVDSSAANTPRMGDEQLAGKCKS